MFVIASLLVIFYLIANIYNFFLFLAYKEYTDFIKVHEKLDILNNNFNSIQTAYVLAYEKQNSIENFVHFDNTLPRKEGKIYEVGERFLEPYEYKIAYFSLLTHFFVKYYNYYVVFDALPYIIGGSILGYVYLCPEEPKAILFSTEEGAKNTVRINDLILKDAFPITLPSNRYYQNILDTDNGISSMRLLKNYYLINPFPIICDFNTHPEFYKKIKRLTLRFVYVNNKTDNNYIFFVSKDVAITFDGK